MEPWEYNYIKRHVMRLTDVDLNCYKDRQMQRRLKAYLARSGHPNWARFFRSLESDTQALDKFKDYLTINVTAFFRDPIKYKFLENKILPELLRERKILRVWSAGSSRGQEPYSLAIMLAEHSTPRRHQVLATDIDHGALTFARAGGPYTKDEVKNISPILLTRYFAIRDDGYYVKDAIKYAVMFRHHNLLSDSFGKRYDLIVCRNVIIYFSRESKEKLYQEFHDALRPGGILFLGGTEVISNAAEKGFETVGVSFYRRKDTAPSR